ncbi:hypothetical protein FAI40_09785 [Acetobacteraceae bacterium]|nr:hypothetical protein FAI40_09785 [Acetobacteraceae bacterium]
MVFLSTLFIQSLPYILTIGLCGIGLAFIPKLNILDIPQARSAHEFPISKGGGIAIILAFCFGFLIWRLINPALLLPFNTLYAFTGIFTLAIFSLIDDIQSQNVWLKLIVQILSSFLITESLGVSSTYTTGFTLLNVIYLNTINFMDGLNGLASGVIVISSFILAFAGAPNVLCYLLSGALLTFLPWNFPRAHIFMGDVGSQTCALILCLIANILIKNHTQFSESYHLRIIFLLPALLNGMLFDVFITLVIRSLKKDPITQAHNTHLYQLAVRSNFLSPFYVTLIQWSFAIWGGIIELFLPLSISLILLLIPQVIWGSLVAYFWRKSSLFQLKNLP